MIRITNGRITLEVSQSAFETMFKPAGFVLEGSSLSPEVTGGSNTPEDFRLPHLGQQEDEEEDSEEPEPEESEEDEEEQPVDYSEVPLSELGYEELCDYADQLGLDREGIRSKKELRGIIREHLKN